MRTCLDRLAAAGIIAPCGLGIVAARIKRADHRPQGWDLHLNLVRDDLDSVAVAVLEHQPRQSCSAVGLHPYQFICAIAVPRSPSVKSRTLRAAMTRASLPILWSAGQSARGRTTGSAQSSHSGVFPELT